MKTEVSAGGVIVRRNRKEWEVLIIKDMNNSWTFPKGLVEKDEKTISAAKREIKEEVGLNTLTLVAALPTIKYFYKRNGLVAKTVNYFLFINNGSEKLIPQKEEGIQEARWVRLAQVFGQIGYPETNKLLLQQAELLLKDYGG